MSKSAEPELKVSHDTMRAERLPLAYRDFCAHLLIPLNKCRQETFFLPWKCTHERHVYEKCHYDEYLSQTERYLEAEKAKLAGGAPNEAKN